MGGKDLDHPIARHGACVLDSMTPTGVPHVACATPPPRRTVRGFTLVEILVVVAILGILAGLALPAIDVLRSKAESAMLSLGSTLQSAQRESVARQHDVIVTFDTLAGRVLVHMDANNDGVFAGGERRQVHHLDPAIVFGRAGAPARPFGAGVVSFPAGPSGLPTLVFRRNGSASLAGGAYLTTLSAAQGNPKRLSDTRAIELVRATGRVEWFRYTGGAWRRGF